MDSDSRLTVLMAFFHATGVNGAADGGGGAISLCENSILYVHKSSFADNFAKAIKPTGSSGFAMSNCTGRSHTSSWRCLCCL